MYKRADGRYQKQIVIGHTEEGKPIRKYIYADTKSELEKKYREFMNLYEKGIAVDTDEITFSELFDLWKRAGNMDAMKTQTRSSFVSILRKPIKEIGNIPIRKLTAHHLDELRAKMSDTPSTFNEAIIKIRTILDFGVQRDLLYKNVAKGTKSIKYEKKMKRALSPFEIAVIDRADLNIRDRAMIDILRYTGIRRGEMLALNCSDVKWERNTILIHQTLVALTGDMQAHTKTESGMREVSMPSALQRSLSAYMNVIEGGLLFPNRDGKPMRPPTFEAVWKSIGKNIFGDDVPEDFTPHIFRHTYASDLYKAGVDLKTAQYLLGHTDIQTTMNTYTHFSSQDVSIEKLERYYENNFSQNLVKDNFKI